jgi:peptidoglycan/LPS O-acetylase OafA/YrhL
VASGRRSARADVLPPEQPMPMTSRAIGSGGRLRPELAHTLEAADGRVPELDAVRGLAAVAIVVYHSNQARFAWGWAAVDLFFVLSGFLITSIVLRSGGTRGFLPRFYARRALRIWPIYYLVVLAVVAFRGALPRPTDLRGLPLDLTFTQNLPLYWADHARRLSPYLGHTWTLAIEEQFYLIWPALVLAVGRRRIVPLSAALVALAVILRARGYPVSLLGARCDGLALGGLLAALLGGTGRGASPALRRGFAATAAVSAVVLVALAASVGISAPNGAPPRPALTVLAFNALWFGLLGLVAAGSGHPRLRFLRSRRLRALGTISYGLYLYHLIIMALSADIARRSGLRFPPILREVPTLALCFGAAALSWRYIERPILGLKDCFAYAPEPTPTAQIGRYRGPRSARGDRSISSTGTAGIEAHREISPDLPG